MIALKKQKHFLFVICLSVLLNGCTLVYKGTGDTMIGYAEDHGVAYMLATDDVAMECSMVEAFTPFLQSFSTVTTPPDKLSVLFYLMSGNCSEFKAWEQELRYLRAVYAHNAIEAQDARIVQQRLLALAAQRQLMSYRYLTKAFVEPGAECPEFASDQDEFYWLVGLVSGIQAVINDITSGGNIQVPMGIATKVGRGAVCLDNDKWWGIPEAIQGAIWLSIPTNAPLNSDPAKMLNDSVEIGLRQGALIPQVLAAQIYLGQGNIEEVKNIIRLDNNGIERAPVDQAYKMLNQVSKLQLRAISDRLWTEATGRRTPVGKLGSFWDDADKVVDTLDIDEIL